MKNKIRTAREMLSKISDSRLKNGDNALLQKLKETADLAELTYNDVIIKRSRSKSAFQSMKDLEHKLDLLLDEAKKINKN